MGRKTSFISFHFIHSFIHSCVHACMHSFIHSFVRSFFRSSVRSFSRSFVPSFVRSFVRSFVHSFIHSFIQSFIHFHPFIHRPSGLVEMKVEIPHTITTWVTQAVAINNKTGLGLATPLRIVGYMDYFISLKMPYSVKRGEQVSLLATVFNYAEMEQTVSFQNNFQFC